MKAWLGPREGVCEKWRRGEAGPEMTGTQAMGQVSGLRYYNDDKS